MASVVRDCLVCGHGGTTNEGKKSYQEISVCPKCNGAYVDVYHIHKYKDKDWKSNKDSINEISIGVGISTGNMQRKLRAIANHAGALANELKGIDKFTCPKCGSELEEWMCHAGNKEIGHRLSCSDCGYRGDVY